MKHELWARELVPTLTGPQIQLLEAYANLLAGRAVPRGYVAAGDRGRLWERHLLDGLRGVPAARSLEGPVADVGSGAGIPGVPMAIAMPERAFTLIEPRKGRVGFLESVVDDLQLGNVAVFHGKSEACPERFGVCVARALASAEGTWLAAEPVLSPAGTVIYWGGSSFADADLAGLGPSVAVSIRSDLAELGPLVIMTRQ